MIKDRKTVRMLCEQYVRVDGGQNFRELPDICRYDHSGEGCGTIKKQTDKIATNSAALDDMLYAISIII